MCRENITLPLNTNPGLEVHRSTNFSGIKLVFTCLVLCCSRLLKLKTKEQTVQTENLTERVQR